MSALGQYGSAIGQGYLQGRQYGDERRQKQQQMGLQERQVALGERAQQQEQELAQEQFAYTQARDLDNLINSPDFNRRYSPGQRQKILLQRKALGERYPKFAYAEPGAEQPAGPPPAPAQPETNPVPTGQALIDAQAQAGAEQQTPQLPDFNILNNPGKINFDPLNGIGGNPNKPVSAGPGITGTQNRVTAGSFPANPFPQETPQASSGQPETPQPTGPPQPQPTLTERTRQRIDDLLQQASDPSLSPEDQQRAAELATVLMGRLKEFAASEANTDLVRAQTREVAPNATSNRAVNAEQIAASQYERGEYKPGLLSLQEKELELKKLQAKQKQGGLSASDWIQILRLQHDINQDASNARLEGQKFDWQRGKDINETMYREGEGQRTADTDARRGMLRVLEKAQMTVDPITHVPVMKPGGLEAYKRGVQELVGQGLTPTTDDLNPGFDPQVWGAVNTPGFDVTRALQAAQAANDQRAVAQFKAASDFIRRATGASAPTSRGPQSRPTTNKQGQKVYRRVYSPEDRDYPQGLRAR